MRKVMFLVLGFFVWQSALAQTPVDISFRDSTGTAVAYAFQIIGIGTKGVQKTVECINDGSVNLSFALSGFDTTASQTTHRVTIKPGELVRVALTTRDSVYVKAASSTCAYRIRTSNTLISSSSGTGATTANVQAVTNAIDSVITKVQNGTNAVDSLVISIYNAQTGGVRDSIKITRSTPNTAYTAGDMYGTSLTAASNLYFGLPNSAIIAGRLGYIEKVKVFADSGYTNVGIRVWFMHDTTGHTAFADNAPFAPDNTYTSILGYVDLTFDGTGTVSTAASTIINSTPHLAYTRGPLFAFVTLTTGSTLKNGGYFIIVIDYLKP